MAKSTAIPEWAGIDDKGGYIVHLVPMPFSLRLLNSISDIAIGKNQKEMLLIRGMAISSLFKYRGISQLANLPLRIGITKKNTILNP